METIDNKFIRILSIDGGGIRGIIPGQILVDLEAMLNDIEKENGKENPNARIADYFDLVVGTSTGGILTCAYLLPDPEQKNKAKYSAQEVVDFYIEHGTEIFKRSAWYKISSLFGWTNEKFRSKNLEKVLDIYFKDVYLKELLKPCVITSYDIERRHGHFFNQHDAKEDEGYNFKVIDVARSTSAAPTYFECARIKSARDVSCSLIDGGVFINNPALCGYAEACQLFRISAKNMFILSLGTGKIDEETYKYKNSKKWGKIGWIKPLIDIMMSGVAETVDFQLRQIFETIQAKDQYVRLNPDIGSNVDPEMDNASKGNIGGLKELGIVAAVQYKHELKRVANLLYKSNSETKPVQYSVIPNFAV